MHNDYPFGYKIFPQDIQITTQTLVGQSKQFDACNTKGNHSWIAIHKIDDTNIVKEAMLERSYKNLQHIFWNKPNHYVEGPVNRLTPCVEMITVGFTPNSSEIHWNVSKDPRQRGNIIHLPSVQTLAKDSSGNIINKTEKPPELSEWLFGMFCKKGSTVLIVGTGAGGCVKGAVMAGMNVVGVENDEKQYNQLFSEMNSWVAKMREEKSEPKAKESKVKKGTETTAPAKANTNVATPDPSLNTSMILAEQEGVCFSCDGFPTSDNTLEACSGCGKKNHIKGCMQDVAGEAGKMDSLVCSGCAAKLFGTDE